jgi:hypothetical protein
VSKGDALVGDHSEETGASQLSQSLVQADQSSVAPVLRVVRSADDLARDLPLTRHSPPEDWSDLIEQVRREAARVRDVEAQAEEQELHVRELLERVREDIKSANDRAQAAEAHALDIQRRAGALLAAADERVKAAEERARVAESWLQLVKKTFAEEFAGHKAKRRSA